MHEDKPCPCGGTLRYRDRYHMYGQNAYLVQFSYELYVCDVCRKMELYMEPEEGFPVPSVEDQRAALYRGYSAGKLQKIIDDPSYQPDARELARRVLREKTGQ